MGLFDFLLAKPKQEPEHSANAVPYLGDLNKTNRLYTLVQVPQAKRDSAWEKSFLENVSAASFRSGNPQVQLGPDGLPYFQLFLPESNVGFQCYVIDTMKDDFLLAAGYGVTINPTKTGADWVFSYGDILNLYLNKEFYTDTETSFLKAENGVKIQANEEIMVAQPAENLLPKQSQQIILNFLKESGIQTPKISLLMRHKKKGKGMVQDLVFNIDAQNFKDEQCYQRVVQKLAWYLPKHYTFITTTDKRFLEVK
jgi:hypothetical protein